MTFARPAASTWQLAERGRIIPITARGAGTDQTGAALGSGIMVVFPAHMNRVLELDNKNNTVTVEPGINYAKLQQTLQTHGRFLPPYPASEEYSTIGGAIANNAGGEKSVKYGDTRRYLKGLRVVLANGEVIETGRLSKRDANKKLGLATFEGEIYRSIDTLLEENHNVLEQLQRDVTRNNAGYNLLDIKGKDGSFDLTPLIAGSQGTLGIITEAVLGTEAHNPQTTVILAKFDSLEHTQQAVLALKELPEPPSAIEFINDSALQEVHELNPNQLNDLIQTPFPAVTMIVEFDGNEKAVKKVGKKASKILEEYAVDFEVSDDPERQQHFWQIRQSTSALIGHNQGLLRAVPIIDDAAVPVDRLREFIEGVYKLLNTNNLPPAVWGHAGDANLHVQPRLNVGQVGDRQKAFRLLDEYNKLVIKLGGTISSEAGDGRLKTPYIEAMYGSEAYSLFQKIKADIRPLWHHESGC